MVQGTTPTLLFKFSVDLDLIKQWRICFYQEGEENLVKTEADCVVDKNKVIYVKLTQEETFAFDDKKVLKIKCKALTQDGNVIPSQTIKMFVCEMQDKVLFDIENTPSQIIDTSTINFEFETEPCGFGLDFEELYIEQVGTGGGNGKDGVGIQSIEQTTTSTEDSGINVVTVTLTNGTKTTFEVRNGSKGKDGKDGKDGADGNDYILTDTDKTDIATLVLDLLPNGDEVSY